MEPTYKLVTLALYQATGTSDYSKMVATPRGVKGAASWPQATNLLQQFSLGLEGIG